MINIAIVDDHTLFRKGLSGLLEEFKELKVLFDAENGRQMIQYITSIQEKPSIILMDINMPVMDGYESTIWIKENYPSIHVLALSMYDDDEAVIKIIKHGACGYILKRSKPKELLEAIKVADEKGVFLNELVSGKLIRTLSSSNQPKFTDRETEFLKLACSEFSYKEIADQMCVSPRTVDNYRESLFLKLNLKTRTGLVLYAIKKKIYKVE
ncbi:response regulator [Mucilaginibacter angelicae]|uniref:Response regulator n=1 Tax=Mucilaginibacter angelicae TaxID=869718 RepID=A0ABV6L0W3_9SPHI